MSRGQHWAVKCPPIVWTQYGLSIEKGNQWLIWAKMQWGKRLPSRIRSMTSPFWRGILSWTNCVNLGVPSFQRKCGGFEFCYRRRVWGIRDGQQEQTHPIFFGGAFKNPFISYNKTSHFLGLEGVPTRSYDNLPVDELEKPRAIAVKLGATGNLQLMPWERLFLRKFQVGS